MKYLVLAFVFSLFSTVAAQNHEPYPYNNCTFKLITTGYSKTSKPDSNNQSVFRKMSLLGVNIRDSFFYSYRFCNKDSIALGKLGWSPYQYYTSSPCEVYYAFKGYFDKEEHQMLVMRKVAQAASAGFVKGDDFEKFWPAPERLSTPDIPSWAATSIELRKKIISDLKK